MHNYSTKAVGGNFNADQLSTSHVAVFMNQLISDHYVAFGATYHREDSDMALDLCLVDAVDTVLEYWKTDTPFADGHNLIPATVKSPITKPVLHDFIYRDYKSIDKESLQKHLNSCN